MSEEHKPYRFHIGIRNFKTALSATLCAVLYLFFDRNPTFACIGAIFGTGKEMQDSWLNGGNRLIGTVIGGFIGMALFRIYICFQPEGGIHWSLFIFLFIGVILLVEMCQMFRWIGGIQPGGVVLCIILFNTPVDAFVSYSINRMLDTAIGVVVALFINLLLPRERVTKWLDLLKSKFKKQEITK